jgi:protein-S-isoprenylcysteine O-methyltransferase Ste14
MIRWAVKSVIFALLVGLALFLGAGTLRWEMAWVYVGLYLLQQAILTLILPAELLVERSAMQEGTKRWDRALSFLSALVLPLALYLVAGLDRRYGWTASLPATVRGIALALMVLGMALTGWAMSVNRFFSGTVRIQTERGHRVVRAGPYQYVRHPGYVGGIMHHVAAPLVLGSLWALIPGLLGAVALVARTALEDRTLWALIPGLLGAVALVARTALEDRTLRDELPGYAEYARRTRHRLVPGAW